MNQGTTKGIKQSLREWPQGTADILITSILVKINVIKLFSGQLENTNTH
jgi:hypothetical protein